MCSLWLYTYFTHTRRSTCWLSCWSWWKFVTLELELISILRQSVLFSVACVTYSLFLSLCIWRQANMCVCVCVLVSHSVILLIIVVFYICACKDMNLGAWDAWLITSEFWSLTIILYKLFWPGAPFITSIIFIIILLLYDHLHLSS